MALNIRPGIGERGQRVFNFPISARGDFQAGLLVVGRAVVDARKFKSIKARVVAEAQVSDNSIAGTIEFYDVTSGDTQLLSQAVNSDQPTQYEVDLALDFSTPREIEIRAGLAVGPTYTDSQVLIVWFGRVELTTVF